METVETTNNSSFPDSEYLPKSVRIIDAVILLLITVIGLTGNTLIFLAYILSHKIRTKTNIFVLNLALADFLSCLFFPISAWYLVREIDVIEPWFDIICGIVMACVTSFILTSLILLFSIAVNRYILITRSPQRYNILYRTRNIVIWLLFAWIYPIIVTAVPLAFGVGHLGFDITSHTCGPRTDHKYSYLRDLIMAISASPMPIAVTTCYIGIYLYIRRHNKRMLAYTLQSKETTAHRSQENPQNIRSGPIMDSDNSKTRQVTKQNLDITTNLFIVVVTYLVCVSPGIVCEIINAPRYITIHTRFLVTLNSCLNPIIYGVKHPHFRQVFKNIILRRWREIPQPAFTWMKTSQQCKSRDIDSHDVINTNTRHSSNTVCETS